MSQYYLMSQLPSLDGLSETAPLPITEERFCDLCGRFLNDKMMVTLRGLTLTPAKEGETTASPLVHAWNEGERQLRLALAHIRAGRMGKASEVDPRAFPLSLIRAAETAAGMDDPLEAETYLGRYRLDFLETLRPMDPFSDEAVFYYGLKLKLLARVRAFDREAGQAAYRHMYTSILRGEV